MKFKWLASLMAASILAASCGAQDNMADHTPAPMPVVPAGDQSITLGAGCFWCTEAVFRQVPGVVDVTCGYMGGHGTNVTYEAVCTGSTGYAEVSMIVFDPKKTSLEKILDVFYHAHDPTSLNRQGNDVGTQYRSAIFYHTDAQKQIADKWKKDLGEKLQDPVVTEITKATEFYPAEKYHQDYYRLNKDRNPYCSVVIAPKLKKLGMKE
jgi:peptide-methionine (S)-S-oxide reductase